MLTNKRNYRSRLEIVQEMIRANDQCNNKRKSTDLLWNLNY